MELSVLLKKEARIKALCLALPCLALVYIHLNECLVDQERIGSEEPMLLASDPRNAED